MTTTLDQPGPAVPQRRGEAPRYAVYYAPPPGHLLWQAGCRWLGRDPADPPASAPPPRAEVTEPWRYGFHATLKAPLRLASGQDEAGLLRALAAVAARHARFAMPALAVDWLGGFLALRPQAALPEGHALRRLADDCVLSLEPWRAALSAAEHTRQLRAAHSARQREHVARLGYAHVLQDWRFHMTLSNTFDQADPDQSRQCAALTQRARQHFAAALAQPLQADALSLFVQAAPGEPFQLRQRLPLAGA